MSAKIQLPYTLFLVSWALLGLIGLSAFVIFGNGQQMVPFLGPEEARYMLAGSAVAYVLVDIRMLSSILEQKRRIRVRRQRWQ